MFSCLVAIWDTISLKFLSTRIKNAKSTIFFLIIVKNIAQAIDVIRKQLEDIKISKDNFLGDDLSFERTFLDDAMKCLEKS